LFQDPCDYIYLRPRRSGICRTLVFRDYQHNTEIRRQ
jgi:hypothetical protein